MAETKALTYQNSGVNYELLDPFKIKCQRAAATTAGNIEKFDRYGLTVTEITQSRGESAYEIDVIVHQPTRFRIAHVEEGLGTKNVVAEQLRELQEKIDLTDEIAGTYGRSFYKGIGIDNVAMIMNDLATSGAIPLNFMLHTAAYPSEWFLDQQRTEDLVAGTLEACNRVKSAWGGGESPALGVIINPGHAVISGSGIGFKFPDQNGHVNEKQIQAGNRIILIESTGAHSNGISLARGKIRELLPNGYETLLSNGQTYGEALLTPTQLYSPVIDEVYSSGARINYALHISGHGWRKIMRPEANFTYVIDKIPEPHPIFEVIQSRSGMSDEQIYGDYNMGAGFALFVPEEDVDKVLVATEKAGQKAIDAGYIESGPRRVVIRPIEVEYKGESLQIR